MGDKMDHTLINPNQLRAYGLTVQDNPFSDSPIFIATEGHEFVLPLSSKGTILGVNTRTPTNAELQSCPHVPLSSEHEWDPQNVCFPKASRTVEEEVARTVGAVRTDDAYNTTDWNDNNNDCLLHIGNILQRLIASVKVTSIPRNRKRKASQVETEAQDVPQLKIFQSKG